MDFVLPTCVPSVCQHSADLNHSFPCLHEPNTSPTAPSPLSPPTFSMSYFTMSFGALSNLMGLAILCMSQVRFHRRAKTPFLFLVAALLLTDLVGHLVTGSFALHLHLGRVLQHREEVRGIEPPRRLCKLFGACMVFFGLSPLLLGSVMAVERCVSITQPLLHSTLITTDHVCFAVLLLFSLAFALAMLPLVDVGGYTPQFPGTWCFLPVLGTLSPIDAGLALAFSSLGLVALVVSVFCNVLSGLTLLHSRLIKPRLTSTAARRHASSVCPTLNSLDVEMMVQLLVLTVVSCVCWSPFLIYISISVRQFYRGNVRVDEQYKQVLLLALRMAAWNQILDPWVYILLRRSVLSRLCRLLRPHGAILTRSHSSMCIGGDSLFRGA